MAPAEARTSLFIANVCSHKTNTWCVQRTSECGCHRFVAGVQKSCAAAWKKQGQRKVEREGRRAVRFAFRGKAGTPGEGQGTLILADSRWYEQLAKISGD